jgi:hypothetical protein
MKRLLFLTGSALCLAGPLAAQQQPAAADTAVHVVRPGDTLWDLARQYLSNPYLWPEIYRLNRDVVANPNRIFPSERLRLPMLTARPDQVAVQQPDGEARTVFYPTRRPGAGSTIEELASARVPVVKEGDFYRAGMLVREGEIVPVGQIAEVESPTVVAMHSPRAIQPNDRVFVKLAGRGSVLAGDRLQLVRRDRAVGAYGRIYVSTGLASVVAVQGDVATVVVDRMTDAVAAGDWAVPIASFPVAAGVRPEPAEGLAGRIVAFESPHAVQAVDDVAFLDLGQESGVKEGDEFVAVLPATAVSWGTRPEIEVARLQVVRVSRRTAAVRVVAMEQPSLVPGLPVRLVGKMP